MFARRAAWRPWGTGAKAPTTNPAAPPPSPTYPPPPTNTPCPIQFSDVHPSDYFYQAVEYLACNYSISGYSDGTFRPYNLTTRAQMVKIVLGGGGSKGQASPSTTPGPTYCFADVLPNNPFFYYIEQAAQYGIVSGYICGGPSEPCDALGRPYFRPNGYVTRGQLAKILALGVAWTLSAPPVATFADVPPGSPFYRYVETAACLHAVSGSTCGGPGEPCDSAHRPYFRPYHNAIRAQIAKIMYEALFQPPYGTGTPTVAPAP